jgi:hypothetical protein
MRMRANAGHGEPKEDDQAGSQHIVNEGRAWVLASFAVVLGAEARQSSGGCFTSSHASPFLACCGSSAEHKKGFVLCGHHM